MPQGFGALTVIDGLQDGLARYFAQLRSAAIHLGLRAVLPLAFSLRRRCGECRETPSWPGTLTFPPEEAAGDARVGDAASAELTLHFRLSRRAVQPPPVTFARVSPALRSLLLDGSEASSSALTLLRLLSSAPAQVCLCHQLPVAGPPDSPAPCYCAVQPRGPLRAEQLREGVTIPPSDNVAVTAEAARLAKETTFPPLP